MLVELDISGSIAIVKLNRPERANALNPELLKLLARLQDQLRRNHRMRAVITLAEGPGFSAGSDLEELGGVSPKVAVQSQWLEARVCRGFLALPQPTIAAVHGYALGGGLFLAAHHDFRVVASDARLGCPEVKLGWNPTFGMKRLFQIAGAAALRWVITGDEFKASEALAAGLATSVVQPADLRGEALRLAERLAALPPAGLAAVKKALWQKTHTGLQRADRIGARLFRQCLAKPEAQASLRRYLKETRREKSKRVHDR